MDSKTTKRQLVTIYLGLGTVAALVVGLIIKARLFPVPIEVQAKQVLDCELSDNAGCIEDYIPAREVSAYHLTPEKLQRLLERFIDPIYRGKMKGKPEIKQMPLRSEGYYIYGALWPRPDSERPLVRSVRLAITKNGPQAPDLVSTLIEGALLDKYRQPTDIIHYPALIRAVDHEMPLLTELGFDGLYDEETGRINSWKELRDRWSKSEADWEARVSASAG